MAAIDFRVFPVMVIEVTRQAMAEKKWWKMDFRGYMVGNGFSRVFRRGHRGSPVDNGRKKKKFTAVIW